MINVILFVVVASAHASPAVGRGQAVRDVIWTHLTGRYPKLQLLDIRLCPADEGCVWINDAKVALEAPRPAFADLPGARLLGTTGDRARPWMLFVTRDQNATLIWAYYDRPARRLKFAGSNRVPADRKALLITRAYLDAALFDLPASEF